MSVDIIIPTYNRAKILKETLESVKNQTYENWKCFICEDGETEETYSAVKPFLTDKRFVYLPGEHSGRPAVSRNRGIKSGNSEFIAFLDDDDIWLSDKLEKEVKYMKNNSECVLVSSNAYKWDGIEPINTELPKYFQDNIKLGKIDYEDLTKVNKIINSSALIRRKVLNQTGYLNEKLELRAVEDYEFWLRVGTCGNVFALKEPLIIYRDDNAKSIRGISNVEQEYLKLKNVFENALIGCLDKRPIKEGTLHYENCKKFFEFYSIEPKSELNLKRLIKNILSKLR